MPQARFEQYFTNGIGNANKHEKLYRCEDDVEGLGEGFFADLKQIIWLFTQNDTDHHLGRAFHPKGISPTTPSGEGGEFLGTNQQHAPVLSHEARGVGSEYQPTTQSGPFS
jgi:hypothetical protein